MDRPKSQLEREYCVAYHRQTGGGAGGGNLSWGRTGPPRPGEHVYLSMSAGFVDGTLKEGVVDESRMRDLIAADVDSGAYTRNYRPLALSECRRVSESGTWVAPMYFDFDVETNGSPIDDAWMLDFTKSVVIPGVRACYPGGELESIFDNGAPAVCVCMSGEIKSDGSCALRPKDLSYKVCGKCESPLAQEAICLACPQCKLGYDEDTLCCAYEKDSDGTWIDAYSSDLPSAQHVRRFKCGAHIRFVNAPLSCTDSKPVGAGPFVGYDEAMKIYSEVLQRAKSHYADDKRFGARYGYVIENELDPRVYESAGLRVMKTVKMMRCPVCQSKDGFVSACVHCGTRGQIVDDRPYVVVAALRLDGTVHEQVTTRARRDTRILLDMTSIRPPPCVEITPGCVLSVHTPMYRERIKNNQRSRLDIRVGTRPLPPPSSSANSSARVKGSEKSCTDDETARVVQSYIRSLDVKDSEGVRVYANIVVSKIFRFSSGKAPPKQDAPYIVEVQGSGSHFCANKKPRPGDVDPHVHRSSKIYFLIRRQPSRKRDGHAPPIRLRQCCLSEKEGLNGCAGTTCRQWSKGPHYGADLGIISRDIAMRLFPWHDAGAVVTKMGPKTIAPRFCVGGTRRQHQRAIAELIQSAQAVAHGRVQDVELILHRSVPRDVKAKKKSGSSEYSVSVEDAVRKEEKAAAVMKRSSREMMATRKKKPTKKKKSGWTASIRRKLQKEPDKAPPRQSRSSRHPLHEEELETDSSDGEDKFDAPLFKDSAVTARQLADMRRQSAN